MDAEARSASAETTWFLGRSELVGTICAGGHHAETLGPVAKRKCREGCLEPVGLDCRSCKVMRWTG